MITPTITENILEGITRRTAIELAQEELGIQTLERPIDRTEIYLSDELFMTGTAAQIVAITRVDHREIGNGKMGPISSQLRELYQQVVRGKLTKYKNWNTPVYPS
jgi:branched-chain amino acid aminotransferase